MARSFLLHCPIDAVSLDQALAELTTWAGAPVGSPCRPIAFLNAHCGNVAARNPLYRRALNRAHRVYPDGIGVKLAGRLRGVEVGENLNGTDLFPLLMDRLEADGRSVFFLGAKQRTVEALAQVVRLRWPRLTVAGTRSGFFSDPEAVAAEVAQSQAEVLFVAMGVPRQELWIDRYAAETGCRVALAVGGLFDFYSGQMPRAPLWMRRLTLEWLFRLIQEPGRMWRRYLVGNLEYLARACLWPWSPSRRRETGPADSP